MLHEFAILTLTAVSIGFLHTVFGPDHYLPFIAMSHARKWSLTKTCAITFLCGLAHILSAVMLGIIGAGFGMTLDRLKFIEAFRGHLAGWLLIGFGLSYFVWGLRRAVRGSSGAKPESDDSSKLIPSFLFAVFSRRDTGGHTSLDQSFPEPVSIITAVCEQSRR